MICLFKPKSTAMKFLKNILRTIGFVLLLLALSVVDRGRPYPQDSEDY